MFMLTLSFIILIIFRCFVICITITLKQKNPKKLQSREYTFKIESEILLLNLLTLGKHSPFKSTQSITVHANGLVSIF